MRGIKLQRAPIDGTDAPEPKPIEPLLYTYGECAEQLRCTERYIYMLVARGELQILRLGTSPRVRASDLQAYVDKLVEEERQLRSRAGSAVELVDATPAA